MDVPRCVFYDRVSILQFSCPNGCQFFVLRALPTCNLADPLIYARSFGSAVDLFSSDTTLMASLFYDYRNGPSAYFLLHAFSPLINIR